MPEHRGRGYGLTLWRAAMHWGHEHGAAYQLLQTVVGGASDRLCAGEGLTSLGVVHQIKATGDRSRGHAPSRAVNRTGRRYCP
ncbi:GNAT family N-acetyltransferase [Streptomyces sp. NPDC102270]|uniref:GNAT family N-acetyltransferase n=1 Tax=Streptomyces sp. NPDC102270 TaxID=3366150 RepID=UPI003803F0A2